MSFEPDEHNFVDKGDGRMNTIVSLMIYDIMKGFLGVETLTLSSLGGSSDHSWISQRYCRRRQNHG